MREVALYAPPPGASHAPSILSFIPALAPIPYPLQLDHSLHAREQNTASALVLIGLSVSSSHTHAHTHTHTHTHTHALHRKPFCLPQASTIRE